jgi:polysaccharide biosynthesis protein PslH
VKRRLLFLCQTLPFPPDGGVWIRTYNVLRQLAREYQITLLCFERAISSRDGFSFDETSAIRALSTIADTKVFRIPQRSSKARLLWDHGRSLALGSVYTEYLYESRALRDSLEKLLQREHFDLVHVDSLDLSGYLPLLPLNRTIVVHHNVESELLRRRALLERSVLRRAYIARQSALMEKAESEWCPRVVLNVAVSARDAQELRELAPAAQVTVVPNGVDTETFVPRKQPPAGITFVGGANWFPNRDALQFFADDILPLLGDLRPKVSWVGAAQEHDRLAFAEKGVVLTGYVTDIRPLVWDARCYVVPLRVGGGSRLKILDAWAMGKAVVSTSVGCEGLSARDGENLLIADTPGDFAAAVRRVLTDVALAEQLGAAARRTVEREYSWDVVGADMLRQYDRIT